MHPEKTSVNRNRFLIGIVLNSAYVVTELYFGFLANSVALVSDAVHNASDAIGLCLIWFSYYLAQRPPSVKFTFGLKKATIVAAFLNSSLLIIAIGNILWESIKRLITPEEVTSWIVISVAGVGFIVNLCTALIFIRGKERDLNIASVFLDMVLDALLSLAVVIGGIFIWWQNWSFVDPLLGIIIGVILIYSVWKLFRESLHLIMLAVPAYIDLEEVIHDIRAMPEIIAYHGLHIWALSTTENALSIHIVTNERDFNPVLTAKLAELFHTKYHISHATIQLEVSGSEKSCILHT